MVSYHPFDETIWDEPFDVHKALRDEAPAYYLDEFNCWFISRFEDIWNLEQDQRNFTSEFGTTTTHLLTHQTPSAPNLTSYDGRQHARIRSYFNPFFKPGFAKQLEDRTRAFTRQLIDEVMDRGRADLLGDLGGRLSSRVACTILGIPIEDADMVMDWVNAYFHRDAGTRGTDAVGMTAQKELGLYLFKLAARARREGAPEGSVLQKLLTTELEGQIADDKAIAIHLNMMAIGGTETFPKIFSATLYRLWQNPEQRAACIEDPSRIPDAFYEALRFDMPTHMLGRTVKTGFALHGQRLEPGAGVMFLWGSGNRDEREFENPDRFDIDRRAPRILSFGHGQHSCLGAHIAKMEGRVILSEMLRRIPDYQVDESGIERIQSEFFRGFAKLPITFAPGGRSE